MDIIHGYIYTYLSAWEEWPKLYRIVHSKEAKNWKGWSCSEKYQLVAKLNSLLTIKEKKQLVSYEHNFQLQASGEISIIVENLKVLVENLKDFPKAIPSRLIEKL